MAAALPSQVPVQSAAAANPLFGSLQAGEACARASAMPNAQGGGGKPPGNSSDPGSGWGGGGGGGSTASAQPLALLGAVPDPVVLTVASFAVTKMAYVRLTKMFRDDYLRSTGQDVRFRLTFTGSGVQVSMQMVLLKLECRRID